MSDEIKTRFKGPGEWRSQAARIEQGIKEAKDGKTRPAEEVLKELGLEG